MNYLHLEAVIYRKARGPCCRRCSFSDAHSHRACKTKKESRTESFFIVPLRCDKIRQQNISVTPRVRIAVFSLAGIIDITNAFRNDDARNL
jgi:hypothetical protein